MPNYDRYPKPSLAPAQRQVDTLKRVGEIERQLAQPGAVPIGGVIFTFGEVPAGWLALNGQTVSVDEWQKLASAVPRWVVGTMIHLPVIPAPIDASPIVRAR